MWGIIVHSDGIGPNRGFTWDGWYIRQPLRKSFDNLHEPVHGAFANGHSTRFSVAYHLRDAPPIEIVAAN